MLSAMNVHGLESIRKEASLGLDAFRRKALGQFMTPAPIAAFMASLFDIHGSVRLLDAGAGVGSLTAAFLDRLLALKKGGAVECWELEHGLADYLTATLERYTAQGECYQLAIETRLHREDFIERSVLNLGLQQGTRFTHAILNPPYKKLSSASLHRSLLRKANIETVNLYSAFVALSIFLLEPGGQIVAIIPRSFCNGPYYRAFRTIMLAQCAVRRIHLFESRRKPFGDDEVLQENLILHLVKGERQGPVTVSTSHDADFSQLERQDFAFEAIVRANDGDAVIHIPTPQQGHVSSSLFQCGLPQLGIEVSTGPVVDFRLRDYWCQAGMVDSVPLLYPHHLRDGTLVWPRESKKPNALLRHPDVDKWLMPAGNYVLVKRFSAKEELRRVVAHVVSPRDYDSDLIGFENHWNVFHSAKKGLPEDVARGLALFLNSTLLDTFFRVFSGHTQVNASDLRRIRYPSLQQLMTLGCRAGQIGRNQAVIDALIREMEGPL